VPVISSTTTWWRTRSCRATVRCCGCTREWCLDVPGTVTVWYCGCTRHWSRLTAHSTSSISRSTRRTATYSSSRGRTTANNSISSTTTRWKQLSTTPPPTRSALHCYRSALYCDIRAYSPHRMDRNCNCTRKKVLLRVSHTEKNNDNDSNVLFIYSVLNRTRSTEKLKQS